MLDERLNGVLVEATHEVEGKVGSIGCALFSDLNHAVVVHVLDVFKVERLLAPVVVVGCCLDTVAQGSVGIAALVLELSLNKRHVG